MFTDTVLNLFRTNTRRRNQQSPRFAAELFEQRLQLSAIGIAAAIETDSVQPHSYPEDSDLQYPEEATQNSEALGAPSQDPPQQDVTPVNAFPNTLQSPSFNFADDADIQPIILQQPSEITATVEQADSAELSSVFSEAEFGNITIPSLLDNQSVDGEFDPNNPFELNQEEPLSTDLLRDLQDSESEPEPASEADSKVSTKESSNPLVSDQNSDPSPTKDAIPVRAQQLENLIISDTDADDIDGFFANDPEPYLGGRTAAVLAGMSVTVSRRSKHKLQGQE